MAEKGSRTPASGRTAQEHALEISRELPGLEPYYRSTTITDRLRQELEEKGLKGFRRGGKVKRTRVAKVHKGERVLTAKQASKPAVKKALRTTAVKKTVRKPVARRRR